MRSVPIRSLVVASVLAVLVPVPGAATDCNTGTVFSPMWTACQGAFSGTGNDIWPADKEQALNWMKNPNFAPPLGDGYWRFLNNVAPNQGYWDGVMSVVETWEWPRNEFDEYAEDIFKTNFDDYGAPTADAGPFLGFDYDTGTLRFRNYYTGLFAVLLKGSTFYSVFLFDLTVPTNYITDINLANALHSGGSLSHAALIGGTPTTVPEPSSLLLLGSGLLGLGFVGYRRRRK